jgi:hypothetical protein
MKNRRRFFLFYPSLLLLLVLMLGNGAQLRATTPYPTTIELAQINGAEKERLRLAQGHRKFDQQPTGFYVEKGSTVVVTVTVITPAADGAMPVLHVGTLGFNVEGRSREEYPLKAGRNAIAATQCGGLIYLAYTTSKSKSPTGKVRIVFEAESGHVRAPRYVHGVTEQEEFEYMLNVYPTPDVVYHSDYVVVAAARENAMLYKADRERWMQDLHALLEKEDEISGMDNSDPNPVHHRLNAGEVRYLLVSNTSNSPHANSSGYTGYPAASIHRYLTPFTACSGGASCNNSWMLGHELGHQHQQPAYQINLSTESTVNIYSYVVERSIQGSSYNRTSAARWQQARNTYLKLPLEERIYNMSDNSLEAIVGFNHDELRFMVWEQLFLIFGDDFYKRLHRIAREEEVTGGSEQDRRLYLIWKASQIAGYDLREFFDQWGIRVTEQAYEDSLQAKFGRALSRGAVITLPKPADSLIAVTGQQRPAWTPLPLRGISSSEPTLGTVLSRGSWTITTSMDGAADAAVGGDKPEYIIDDDKSSVFSYVKPGKSYNGISAPANHEPSFTIDMKTPATVAYFRYIHRTDGNSEARLRASMVALYGKNTEAEPFTLIKDSIALTVERDEERIDFPQTTCRYVQLVFRDWDKVNGYTIQIAEFYLGPKAEAAETPEEPGETPGPTGIWGSAAPVEAPYTLYPNPVKAGSLFCISSRASSDREDRWTVRIYDASGRKIRERVASATPMVDVLHAPGLFFVSVEASLGRKVFKLAVAKD